MKFSSLLSKLLVTGLAAAGFTAASAAPLSGTVSSAGTLCLGLNPGNITGQECTAQDVSSLTYFDFITGGTGGLTASPGAPGNVLFLSGSGDLMPLVGQTGSINDFAIPGPGDSLATFSSVSPLWTATGTDGATYTYAAVGADVDRSHGGQRARRARHGQHVPERDGLQPVQLHLHDAERRRRDPHDVVAVAVRLLRRQGSGAGFAGAAGPGSRRSGRRCPPPSQVAGNSFRGTGQEGAALAAPFVCAFYAWRVPTGPVRAHATSKSLTTLQGAPNGAMGNLPIS